MFRQRKVGCLSLEVSQNFKFKEDKMKKRNLFVTLLLVMAMLLSACGSKAPAPTPDAPDSTGEPVYGGVLRVASYLPPSVLG